MEPTLRQEFTVDEVDEETVLAVEIGRTPLDQVRAALRIY
jgi:hypothetical protein